jgi:hypothetical protein
MQITGDAVEVPQVSESSLAQPLGNLVNHPRPQTGMAKI